MGRKHQHKIKMTDVGRRSMADINQRKKEKADEARSAEEVEIDEYLDAHYDGKTLTKAFLKIELVKYGLKTRENTIREMKFLLSEYLKRSVEVDGDMMDMVDLVVDNGEDERNEGLIEVEDANEEEEEDNDVGEEIGAMEMVEYEVDDHGFDDTNHMMLDADEGVHDDVANFIVDPTIRIGSKPWIPMFKAYESSIKPGIGKVVTFVDDGHRLKVEMEADGGRDNWNTPFLVDTIDGLEMKVPDRAEFDIEQVVKCFGGAYQVDTIDVHTQQSNRMRLDDFLAKYRGPKPRETLLNIISLEFSGNADMCRQFVAPELVRNMSIVDMVSPDATFNRQWPRQERPNVINYALVGMGDSYTDFHIDFGGSSVFYHVLKGAKVFYVAKPTEENLAKFQEYACSNDDAKEWFGNMVDLYRIEINQGQTLLMPAGFIHAVYTPCDSIVFGGNFLHLNNIPMQLKVYKVETNMRASSDIDDKYFFPHLELVHQLYAEKVILGKLEDANNNLRNIKEFDLPTWTAAECLAMEMKKWIDRDSMKLMTAKRQQNALIQQKEVFSRLESAIQEQAGIHLLGQV